MVLDKLLSFVADEVNGRAPSDSPEWGSEVSRLPPASHLIWDVIGKDPEPSSGPGSKSSFSPEPPKSFVS